MDGSELTNHAVPDSGIVYKSGDCTAAAQQVKSLISSFSDPLTSRSPYSSHVHIGDRLQGCVDEGIEVRGTVPWRSGSLSKEMEQTSKSVAA